MEKSQFEQFVVNNWAQMYNFFCDCCVRQYKTEEETIWCFY